MSVLTTDRLMTNLTLPLSSAMTSALAVFAFASSITPGPNNTLLMASGANFGLRRTVPHGLGVLCGFLGLILLVAVGLGSVFAAVPALHAVLKWGGAAYLVYLAWKIGSSKSLGMGKTSARPMSFFGAVAFQAINPKAWVMSIGAIATYVPQANYWPCVAMALAIFGVINLPCLVIWTSFGVGMRRVLERPGALRVFNLTMATLLVASLWPLFAELR